MSAGGEIQISNSAQSACAVHTYRLLLVLLISTRMLSPSLSLLSSMTDSAAAALGLAGGAAAAAGVDMGDCSGVTEAALLMAAVASAAAAVRAVNACLRSCCSSSGGALVQLPLPRCCSSVSGIASIDRTDMAMGEGECKDKAAQAQGRSTGCGWSSDLQHSSRNSSERTNCGRVEIVLNSTRKQHQTLKTGI